MRAKLLLKIRRDNAAGKKPGKAHAELLAMLMADTYEEGDCIIWSRKNTADTPHFSIDGIKQNVRKLVQECQGIAIKPGRIMHCAKCGESMCVKTEHIVQRTTSQNSKVHAKLGAYSSPIAKAKMAMTKRAKSRYADDVIEEIRTSSESARVMAEKHGMSISYAISIRAGNLRRDYTPSPFRGLGARQR